MINLSNTQAAFFSQRKFYPNWEQIFGRCAPIEVDLGCGRGQYALTRAQITPTVNIVAIDQREKWVRTLHNRVLKLRLSNVQVTRCNILFDLPLLFKEASVSGFTILHPDPWWKRRHYKRKLVQPKLVNELASLLTPSGWVFVQTDVPDLADEIKAIFEANHFCTKNAAVFKRECLKNIESHRGKKCRELDIPVRCMVFFRYKTS